MHGANPRDAIHSFNIRCSSSGKTILEQVLGQPSAVVGIGEDEFGLRYNLMAPVVDDGALELYQQARQYAARLAGSTPNGRIDRTRCRTISPASGIAFDLHTLRHSLHSALLVEVLRKYGSEAQEGNGQPKLDRTPDLTTPAQGLDKPNGGNTALLTPTAPNPQPDSVVREETQTHRHTAFLHLAKRYIVPAIGKPEGLRLVFDIETDGLREAATRIHCMVIADLDSNRVDEFGPNQIDAGLARLSEATYLTGHNIIGFDLPVLRRLHNWAPAHTATVVDTLIASRLVLANIDELDDQAAAMGDPKLGKLRGRHALGFPSASLPGSRAAAVQGCIRPGITMGVRIRHKSASAHHSFAGTVRK
jgi:hypothetical protein